MKQTTFKFLKETTRSFLLLLPLFTFFLFSSCSTNKGKQLQPFELNSVEGKIINSKDLSNKIIVINLWATWCGPCVSEITMLNALQDKYAENDQVVFVAVSNEDEARVKRFLAKKEFNYIQVTNEEFSEKLQSGFVSSIPKHIILDQERKIRTYIDGAPADIVSQLSFSIDELLK